MRTWLMLLAGLVAWSAHFFLLYMIGEFAGDGTAPRIAVLVATLLALASCGLATAAILRTRHADPFDRWRRTLALAALLLGAIAILWQGLPAMLAV